MHRLSETAEFNNSLVLSALYSSNPGSNGECELAVRYEETKTSIWVWDDNWGAEEFTMLPPRAEWREIVRIVLSDDRYCSSINIKDVIIHRNVAPLGQLLAIAWGDDDERKAAAKLMLHLSDNTLVAVSKRSNGLYGNRWLGMLGAVGRHIYDVGVDADDLPELLEPSASDTASVKFALLHEANVIRARWDAEQAAIDLHLAPFNAEIERLVNAWCVGKPRTRYPGGGSVPVGGSTRLRNYLQDQVLAHGALPKGVQLVPPGPDLFNRILPECAIDFDALRAVELAQ